MQRYRLDRFGWVGVALLLVQGLGMLLWSTLLWQRFALTSDYSAYHQAWWLIAHGQLDPFSTILGLPFWQNDFELFMWLLAPIGVVLSHGPVLLWLQDVCLVGAEMVAWRWMYEVTATRPVWQGRVLAGVGLVLLLANPWAWWSISFDFHMEFVAAPFALLAAYDLAHERRRAWLWVVLTLLCGDAEATWVAGLGIGALLAGRRWWWKGVGLILLGAGWLLFSVAVHGDSGGSVIGAYGYLAGPGLSSGPSLSTLVFQVATHPGRAVSALFGHRVDLWANLAPGGLVGIANPWVLGLAVPVLLANDLVQGDLFSRPAFQSVLLYVIVPLGTVLVLMLLHRHWVGLALGLGAVAVANALAWSAIWGPATPATWLRVPAASAALLARADALIPPSAEVLASQGVAGRFSDRSLIYPILLPAQQVPLRNRNTWWVVAPSVGIETESSVAGAALVAELAGPLHATLVLQGHGVWVFHWVAPARLQSIVLPGLPSVANAWLFPGAAGRPFLDGPASSWHLVSTGHAGYILVGDYWREPPGHYQASVMLASTGPVNVEVWNATGNVLLARRSIPATYGLQTISMPVDAVRAYPHRLFQGWGPFHAASVPPPAGNQLEIRVWSAGGGGVDVQQVGIDALADG
ncbi:MAG: DUF2079 domain-containing protein [Candidatus Dormibacteria bacterium]